MGAVHRKVPLTPKIALEPLLSVLWEAIGMKGAQSWLSCRIS